jgi:hypothetical protein
MIEADTFDLDCNIHGLDDSSSTTMNDFLEDSFNFTDLATDDFMQGLPLSFNNFEAEAIIKIFDNTSSTDTHENVTTKCTTVDYSTTEDEPRLPIHSGTPWEKSSADLSSQVEYKTISDKTSFYSDGKVVVLSLEAAISKLDECMTRTALSRNLVTKHLPAALCKSLTAITTNQKTKRSGPIKAKAARQSKTKKFSFVQEKNSQGLSTMWLEMLCRKTNPKGMKGNVRPLILEKKSSTFVTPRSRCSIADFLRDSKAKSQWCR